MQPVRAQQSDYNREGVRDRILWKYACLARGMDTEVIKYRHIYPLFAIWPSGLIVDWHCEFLLEQVNLTFQPEQKEFVSVPFSLPERQTSQNV